MNNFNRVLLTVLIAILISSVCIYWLLTPDNLVELETVPVTGVQSTTYIGEGHYLEFALVNSRSKVYKVESAFMPDKYYSIMDNLNPWTEIRNIETSRGIVEVAWNDYYDLFGSKFYDYEYTNRLRNILDPIVDLDNF